MKKMYSNLNTEEIIKPIINTQKEYGETEIKYLGEYHDLCV